MTSLETTPAPIGPLYNPAEWIIICVYLSFLSVLGTAGNALVLVVFYRKKDRQVSTFFILVLAIVDFSTCLVLIPCTLFIEYHDFRISQDFLCKSYMMLNGGMIHFSALIMVAIAVERYFSICHPFLRVLTLTRAKYVLIGLATAATGLGVCIALTYGVTIDEYNLQDSVDHENISEYSINSTISLEVEARGHLGNYELVNTSYSGLNGTVLEKESDVTEDHDLEYYCQAYDQILSHDFQIHFQRLSNTLYVVYLAIVIILYALIYRSVMIRRARRQKQKSACLIQVRQAQEKAKLAERMNAINLQGMQPANERNNKTTSPDNTNNTNNANNISLENIETNVGCATVHTTLKLEGEEEEVNDRQQQQPHQQQQQQHQQQKFHQSKRQRQKNKKQMVDGTMLANMKTAAMLFVVTVVFFVTFTPAFLSAIGLISFKAYLFYLYFANNVANPIIYSFMNRNFRTDLKKLLCNKVD